METEKRDQYLLKEGVKFLPWIGKDYEYGLAYDENGKLVLGEEGSPEQKVLVLNQFINTDEENNDDLSLFAREVVKALLQEGPNFGWKRSYNRFYNAMTDGNDEVSQDALWNHLAYYTYVQKPVIWPNNAPADEDYINSEKPFIKVLKELRPSKVIVWGTNLFNHLMDGDIAEGIKGKEGEDIESEDSYLPTWEYDFTNEGFKTTVIPIRHPSYIGFSCSYWHNVLMKGLKR